MLNRFAPLARYAIASLVLLLVFGASRASAQGPPFQTDDPVPVDLHHYEFYVFGTVDGTHGEVGTVGPAFEFNWGAIPRVQIHGIFPFGAVVPTSGASPGEPTEFGVTDAELGAKIAFYKESKYIPQIGSFTMLELPTGNSAKGLGVGKAWYRLPLWAQKNIGNWLLDGGGGYTVVPQTGSRNFPYGGFLVKYKFNQRLELGTEAVAHGAEGDETPLFRKSTSIDFGGYYHFKNPDHQLLFCYGHSVAGLPETYAYLGLYWTWGKKDDDAAPSSSGLLRDPGRRGAMYN